MANQIDLSDDSVVVDVDINIEYQYYNLLLEEIILTVEDAELKEEILAAIKEMSFTVSSKTRDMRSERNKHLFLLCVSILADNVRSFLLARDRFLHPVRALSPFSTGYTELVQQSRHGARYYKCDSDFLCKVHGLTMQCTDEEPEDIHFILTRLFEFTFFLAHHFVQLIQDPAERESGYKWLCAVLNCFDSCCSYVRGTCVDILQGLIACSYEFELRQPFQTFVHPLLALKEMVPYDDYTREHDPGSRSVKEFITQMPDIHEGIFAFISVSADLFNEIEGYPEASVSEE